MMTFQNKQLLTAKFPCCCVVLQVGKLTLVMYSIFIHAYLNVLLKSSIQMKLQVTV